MADEPTSALDGQAEQRDIRRELLAARSIRHNTGDERPVDLFFKTYGLGEVDWRRVDYYILLDELF